jgi:hypothetical protein
MPTDVETRCRAYFLKLVTPSFHVYQVRSSTQLSGSSSSQSDQKFEEDRTVCSAFSATFQYDKCLSLHQHHRKCVQIGHQTVASTAPLVASGNPDLFSPRSSPHLVAVSAILVWQSERVSGF